MKKFKKGEHVVCINAHATTLTDYAPYRVERMFDSGVYVKIEGIDGALNPERFIKLKPNTMYIGCEVICTEPYFYDIVDVGESLIIDSFTPEGKLKFKEHPDYEFNQNNFSPVVCLPTDPIEETVDEPTIKSIEVNFFFSTPTGVLPVKELKNALKYVDGDDGCFTMGHDSDDETTFWVYKKKPEYTNSELKIGDVVNHTKTNRNGVVYLVEDDLVGVRFWDGGRNHFEKYGNDLKMIRND